MLRRSVRQLVPKRSWQNLSALATGQKNAQAWSELKTRDAKVETTINSAATASVKNVDFEQFEKTTSHPEIVAALKAYYTEQMEILSKLEKEDNAAKVAELSKGWNIHQEAVSNLEKSVEESEKIVQSGVKALWISANNPDISRVKTNEWLDTDLYFQALVERVAALAPSGYQFTKQQGETEESILNTLRLIDDRSNVKRRNTFMAQLHSYEYYDLHRRALLEHITYFLLRTGGDVRFFPEIPPMNWLAHIEKVRRDFAAVAHKKRAAAQLEKLSQHQALDLNPTEYSHGEDFFVDLVNAEAAQAEVQVGKLMGHFGFLSAPLVPVRTVAELESITGKTGGNGEFFSLGDDVNAVFFLPANGAIPKPVEATHNIINAHPELLEGYQSILESAAQIIELRGENWLAATQAGETVADAFQRRVAIDEPAQAVYASYVAQLKKKVAAKTKIASKEAAIQRLNAIAPAVAAEEAAFAAALPALVPALGAAIKEETIAAETLLASNKSLKVSAAQANAVLPKKVASEITIAQYVELLKQATADAEAAKEQLAF